MFTKQEIKNLITSVTGLLSNLTTTDKSSLVAAVNEKVDKIAGKGLSTEDYTTAEQTKLAGLSNYDDTAINNKVGDISALTTTDKSSVVNAINEVSAKPTGGANIDDTAPAPDKVYSSQKTQNEIDTLAANVAGVNNAPSRLFLYYNFT